MISLIHGIKKKKLIDTENRLVVATGRSGMEIMGEGGQNVKSSGYNFWDVMYSMVIIVNNTMLYIWKLLKE